MRARVVAVDTAAEHGDRQAGLQRAAVRGRVDPAREARDDHDPGRSQLAAERRSRPPSRTPSRRAHRRRPPTAVPAGRAARHRGRRGPAEDRGSRPAAAETPDRRVPTQRKPRRASSRRYDSSSNPRRNSANRRAARRVDQVRARSAANTAVASSLMRSAPRSGRYESASARCSGCDRCGGGERSDRRRDTRDARPATARKRQPLDCPRQQVVGRRCPLRWVVAQPAARGEHAIADDRRRFAGRPRQITAARAAARRASRSKRSSSARESLSR